MKFRLLTSLLVVMALGLLAHAQTTVQNTTYSGQTTTVLGPSTIATSGTVTVASGSNVTFAATSSITLNAGFSCSGSTFQATIDTTPPSVPIGFSVTNLANTSFTLNWAASTDNLAGVAHYEVSCNGSSLGTFSGLSANVIGLAPSTMYTMAVRATDALGNTSAWSPAYYVITKPFAAILTAPANNTMVIAPATVALSALAGGTDGTITKVEFYQGSTLIGTVTSPTGQYYQFNWTNVPAATYTLTAKAYDSLSETAVSAPVMIKVDAPPTVSLNAPANAAPGTITLTATASDSDGTISRVDLYQGSSLLATLTSAPYQFNWTNVTTGTYTLTAKATDNDGAATTSAPITVTVANGITGPTGLKIYRPAQ